MTILPAMTVTGEIYTLTGVWGKGGRSGQATVMSVLRLVRRNSALCPECEYVDTDWWHRTIQLV